MTLHASLIERGFALRSDGARLFVSPASRLTDMQREAIKAQKEELLLIVRMEEQLKPTPWDLDVIAAMEAGKTMDGPEYERAWRELREACG